MNVITVAAQKGGSGKSTLVVHMAVEALKRDAPVRLIDIDPQGSITAWTEARAASMPLAPTVELVPVGRRGLGDVLEQCRREGAKTVFIDTPPHGERATQAACAVGDLIVIPCRPSAFDILAIDTTVDIAARIEVPAVIVLNQARPRGTMTDDARAALQAYGVPICPTGIVSRASIADAVIDGRGVQELEPRGKGAAEIAATWRWIKGKL